MALAFRGCVFRSIFMRSKEPAWSLLHQLMRALELDRRVVLTITRRGHYNALDCTYTTDITSDDPLDIADWLFWLKDEFSVP